MILLQLLMMGAALLGAPADESAGSIGGIVSNGSRGGVALAGAEVVLRVNVDGRFVVAAETTTDARGEFRFDHLPADGDFIYLPGANRHGVHYAGQRVQLSPQRPDARVDIEVFDAVSEPNPLIVRRSEISIRPELGVLRVTETLVVANPSRTCYVGRGDFENSEPATLVLSIPPDFDHVTFHKEFYGRRFALADGKLSTAIPWPPGERELAFTYLIPVSRKRWTWARPLDLPCSHLRLRVIADEHEDIVCNLPPAAQQSAGERAFEWSGRVLPAGYVVRLEIGRLPLPWMAYGRWVALVALVVLVVVVSLLAFRRAGRSRPPASTSSSPSCKRWLPERAHRVHARHARRRHRRGRSARTS